MLEALTDGQRQWMIGHVATGLRTLGLAVTPEAIDRELQRQPKAAAAHPDPDAIPPAPLRDRDALIRAASRRQRNAALAEPELRRELELLLAKLVGFAEILAIDTAAQDVVYSVQGAPADGLLLRSTPTRSTTRWSRSWASRVTCARCPHQKPRPRMQMKFPRHRCRTPSSARRGARLVRPRACAARHTPGLDSPLTVFRSRRLSTRRTSRRGAGDERGGSPSRTA